MIQPKLMALNREQMEKVHDYSLRILSGTGVRVDSPRARNLFSSAARVEGDRVYLTGELISSALKTAPSSIEVFDRKGRPAFRLGPGQDRTRFGIGVTTLYYQDPETDAVTPFSRKNMETMTRLGEALPNYDVISTVGIIRDVETDMADLYQALEMAANTVKPLVILVSEERRFPDVLDLLETLRGSDLGTKSFALPYFNPVCPLVMNEGTADKLLLSVERRIPFIYSNYGMAGATTPITAGGTLAMLNAELLAGLVLSQLAAPGAPIILGSLPAFFDMKTMVSFYDPQSFLINLACAEMMAEYYHLPHCGTSGSGMGWGPDLLGAGAYWMNHLSSCLGKVGLAPFVGDNLGSLAFSPASVVYGHEVIGQALRFSAGFDLDEESVAVDQISGVGPGGNFLTTDLTLKSFRHAYYQSPIFPTLDLEGWKARGFPRAEKLLRDSTRRILDGLKAPEDHDELIARGESFLKLRR